MAPTAIEHELLELATEAFHIPVERLAAAGSFSRDLGVDSLAMVELAYRIEAKYDIDLDSKHLDLLDSTGSAARYVESLMAARLDRTGC